jgi:hypothetical protein
MPLTEKSRLILEAMAKGQSYEQILVNELAYTYNDIFAAAREALELSAGNVTSETYQERLDLIRAENPRAYEKWTEEEDRRLMELRRQNISPSRIAEILKRQPSAVQSRLKKFEFVPPKVAPL